MIEGRPPSVAFLFTRSYTKLIHVETRKRL